jgi:phage gp46-like protein
MTNELVQSIVLKTGGSWGDATPEDRQFFRRFAELVAKHEREQCAKVADAWQTEVLNPLYHCDCATAIRRRGEK